MDKLAKLYKNLNYNFKNQKLCIQALTHRSAGPNHNERLEFLGDSVVNFVIASELFKRFPKAREGDLSRRRANLVRRETLAELAQELKITDYLILGTSEQKSGGAQRTSIMSDSFEAVIGAMYLDSNSMDICYDHVLAWYEKRLAEAINTKVEKDPKSRLQEHLQSKSIPLPKYTIEKTEGAAHKQIFKVKCEIETLPEPIFGKGTSRQRAEQSAAKAALTKLTK